MADVVTSSGKSRTPAGNGAAPMSERELRQHVLAVLQRCGWRIMMLPQDRPVGKQAAGWPDIVAVRGQRMLALELKSDIGALTSDQQAWLKALAGVPGIESAVVRPSSMRALESRAASREALSSAPTLKAAAQPRQRSRRKKRPQQPRRDTWQTQR